MKKIIATCIIFAAAFTVATAQPPAHDEPCGAVQVPVGVSTDPGAFQNVAP